MMLIAAGVAVPSVASAAPALHWSPCTEQELAGYDCATIAVPLDYDRPGGATTTIALARRPAGDPASRIGTIFVNPGGPGGPGRGMVTVAERFVGPDVLGRFDIVGFDPRGIGASDPLQCFATDEQAEELLSQMRGVPITKAEIESTLRANHAYTEACKRNAGPLLTHMSTLNVAKDLDVLREAVGDARLNYIGFSYGTHLGATYVNVHPDRVRAVILDGNVDPDQRANRRLANKFDRAGGFEIAFAGFLSTCDNAGPACAFSGGARAKFDRLRERFRQGPQTVPPYGTVTIDDLTGLVSSALYDVVDFARAAQILQIAYDAVFGPDPGHTTLTAQPFPKPPTARGWTTDAARTWIADAVRPGTADAARTGTADAVRPGTADAVRTGTADAARPGTADAARTGTADAARTGITDATQAWTADAARLRNTVATADAAARQPDVPGNAAGRNPAGVTARSTNVTEVQGMTVGVSADGVDVSADRVGADGVAVRVGVGTSPAELGTVDTVGVGGDVGLDGVGAAELTPGVGVGAGRAGEAYSYNANDALFAVNCADAPLPRNAKLYPVFADVFEAAHPTFGRAEAFSEVGCANWPRVDERYAGPWNRRTSSTVLLVNPTYDPATRYDFAQRMSRELGNARLLTLDGFGHTARHSACITGWYSKYLIDGALPPAGTRCSQDLSPFPN